ncbi:hypothetical protein AB0B50_14595 [Streptomyces sp. NPDC041068]|uniref:hypothetical protein n=1 Tax=Streptomyces sp. NPDC041068 TaxID=3155130 RepID=UPI0033C678C3
MAFSAEELRVLRRALALALHPSPVCDEDVQDCLRLAESVDEAVREGARLRAFLMADLARYRAALPGTASGYLALLEDVLGTGYQPGPDDLAALRALRGNATAAALLDRCRTLAEQAVRARLAGRAVPAAAPAPTARRAAVPASRTRLLALPGGLAAAEGPTAPEPKAPPERPATPEPSRPVPTPAEVFPPKRRPAEPTTPTDPPHQLAAG